MKRAFILLSLFVLVACEQGKQIMKPVVTSEQPAETVELLDDTTESLPAITFENVSELEPGQRYRMIPTEVNGGSELEGDDKIWNVSWGSVGGIRQLSWKDLQTMTRKLRHGSQCQMLSTT